jgi:RHS repeat-associated protein
VPSASRLRCPHPRQGSAAQQRHSRRRRPTSQRSQCSTYAELPHSPAGAIAPRTNRGELVRRAGATPRAPACGGITIDALNRVTSITTPDASLLEPLYNEASLLEALSVYLRGATTATPIIKDLDYNARGQRTRIEYSDDEGTAPFATEYHYDELTFRLRRLTTTRVSPSNTLQDLRYEFDPVGNIIRIQDDAQQSLFYDDAFVAPENLYTYDAVYRLIEATGREHASIANTQLDHNDQPIRNLPLPTDPSAVRSYQEQYTYDRVGNLLELFHSAGGGANTWTRTYSYTTGTNRLASNTIPGGSATYTHDAHGSITSMPHLASITYGPFDQMASADLGGGGDAYYQYDASGQRVRKLIDTGANLIKERIYLGAYEIYREHISGDIDLERQSLHVMDGTRRVAVLETLTIEDGNPVTTPVTHQRFQLGNHLDSALLEVDEAGMVVSYEELLPYGASAYRSARSGVEVSARRYRYTGKERDDETGLYYHGARYYACWLGRWTSADPLGTRADGPGLYNYTRGSPVVYSDPSGTDARSDYLRAQDAFRQEMSAAEKADDRRAMEAATASFRGAEAQFLRYEAGRQILERYQADRASPLPSEQEAASQVRTAVSAQASATPALSQAAPPPVPLMPSQVPARSPGFDRGHPEAPAPYSLQQFGRDLLEGFLAGFVGEAGAPANQADVDRQEESLSNLHFGVSIALLVGGPKLLPRANDLTATEARILRAADGERQRLLLPGLKVETKQFGKKVGKHAEDFGLNPSSPADRDWVRGRIDSIVSGPEDVRQGPWNPRGGGGSDYLFYRQGADVVITKPSGDFVTVLPGGQTNGWFNGATSLIH